MTVIAMDTAPEGVRGELTRWFLELKPGVFVGKVSMRVYGDPKRSVVDLEGVQLIMVQNEKGKKEEEELLKFPFEIDFLDA